MAMCGAKEGRAKVHLVLVQNTLNGTVVGIRKTALGEMQQTREKRIQL